MSYKSSDAHWRPHTRKHSQLENTILPFHYEDKPKNNNFRSLNSFSYTVKQFWRDRSKRKMIFKAFSLSCVLYVFYYLLFSSKSSKSTLSLHDSTFSPFIDRVEVKAKQDQVKAVFKESFNDYYKNAWGYDVYNVKSKKGENMGSRPLGWMIVDSLDTLYLMDLKDEIKHSRKWVDNVLDYDFDYAVNTFETTIRMLGGLLSAYYLSEDKLYLDKAIDLGDRIVGAFDSPSGIPYASVNLHTKKGIKSHADGGASSTAEAGTLQLEFKYLAQLTGNAAYWEKAEKVIEVLYNNNLPDDGLVPIFVNADTGKFQGNYIRLGSRGDSYYEYLLKQFIQTKELIYHQLYRESVDGVKKHMTKFSGGPNRLRFIGELENGINGELSSKMDHLVCFYGGSLALGATNGEPVDQFKKNHLWTSTKNDDLQFGKDLTKTCYMMYNLTETGLAPEIVVFNTDASSSDFYIKPADRHNLQRPETVESLFILYRITKDPIYRKWGWEIFENFVKYTKLPDSKGFDSISDVTDPDNVRFRDNMESFWLAETLKYLYLLFETDDSVCALNKIVFNTEAHPLPIFEPKFPTGWKLKKNLEGGLGIDKTLNFKENERVKNHAEFDKKMKSKLPKDEKTEDSVPFKDRQELMEESKKVIEELHAVPNAKPADKPLNQQIEEEIEIEEGKKLIQEIDESDSKDDVEIKKNVDDNKVDDNVVILSPNKDELKIKEEIAKGKDPAAVIEEVAGI